MLKFVGMLALALVPALGEAQFWTPTGSMGTSRGEFTGTLLLDGRVLAAGGHAYPYAFDTAEVYDPATGTWTPTGPMIPADGCDGGGRFTHTAVRLPDGKVLVAGGLSNCFGVQHAVSSAEIYDPATNAWTATSSMVSVRSGHTATLLANGKVLVAGGFGNAGSQSSSEIYNPATGTWTPTGSMNVPRGWHVAIKLTASGWVLVAGGRDSTAAAVASAELYNPASGKWKLTTVPMTTAREGCPATELPDGQVLVSGGPTCWVGCEHTPADLYDPATGFWSATTPLATQRGGGHIQVLLQNGKVLAAGGTGYQSFNTSAEIYDPTARTWTLTGSMSTGRSGFPGVVLLGGQVLAAGGSTWFDGQTTAAAELYSVAP